MGSIEHLHCALWWVVLIVDVVYIMMGSIGTDC